jgi:RNA polymerase sigma-70 factor (ECF subfamily)
MTVAKAVQLGHSESHHSGGCAKVPQFRPDILRKLLSEDREALLRYVRRFLRGRADPEDIVQEALLRTCEHAEDLAEPRAFAFTVARNLATDSLRHTQMAKTDSLGDLSESSVVSSGPSPEGETLADEEGRLLREAVEQLSPQCRAAFTLRVFQFCSYKEIALRLGISPKTVENHIGRALRETHDYLRRRYQLGTDHGRHSSPAKR